MSTQVLEAIDTGKLLQAIKRRRKPARTRKVSEIEARIELLDQMFTEGKISKVRFERMQSGLLERLADARSVEPNYGSDLPAELARNLTERWGGLEISTRRRIIGAVLERIEVDRATSHGKIDAGRVRLIWR